MLCVRAILEFQHGLDFFDHEIRIRMVGDRLISSESGKPKRESNEGDEKKDKMNFLDAQLIDNQV